MIRTIFAALLILAFFTGAYGQSGTSHKITINGYSDDAMEPYITRDGQHLLWNNLNSPSVNTDLHWARKINVDTFEYLGPISGVNTTFLEGTPSVDVNGKLYFISPRSYGTTFSTIYRGTFTDGVVTGVELIPGNVSRVQPPWFNMDAEISGDGNTLFFVEGLFNPVAGMPSTADIQIAVLTAGEFIRAINSPALMANINTPEFEYAPAISNDGLTLFFTRATGIIAGQGTGANLRIYMSKRLSTSSQFGVPKHLTAISGFIEGPTVTSDGRFIYYHKRDTNNKMVIYKYQIKACESGK